MKSIKITVLIIFTAVIFSSCGCVDFIKSLFSIYTKDTLVFKPSLVGTWIRERPKDDYDEYLDEEVDEGFELCSEEDNPIEKYVFYEEGNAYKVEKIDKKGNIALLKVHLVQIGDNYFLDIFPHKNQERPKSEGCFMLAHMIAKINFLNNNLMEMCLFKNNLKWIVSTDGSMTSVEEDLITTRTTGKISTNSSTADVQIFLKKYGSSKEAFSQLGTVRFEKVKTKGLN